MERDRFARKVGKKVGEFVQDRIMDADIPDILMALSVGTALFLIDRMAPKSRVPQVFIEAFKKPTR